MTSNFLMRECRRTARNLQRFLDRDPSAPLSEDDRRRVEAHLKECEKCRTLSEEFQALHSSLSDLGSTLAPSDEAVDRVKAALDRALQAETGQP
ncbi:MAG: zf-HC2 domain-containing protein [Actinomycetales bacterium]|nr:zf-HC2 domain-containing protein [Actinomycetales bacterium]